MCLSNAQRHVTKRCWLNVNRSHCPLPRKVAKIDSLLEDNNPAHNEDKSDSESDSGTVYVK